MQNKAGCLSYQEDPKVSHYNLKACVKLQLSVLFGIGLSQNFGSKSENDRRSKLENSSKYF